MVLINVVVRKPQENDSLAFNKMSDSEHDDVELSFIHKQRLNTINQLVANNMYLTGLQIIHCGFFKLSLSNFNQL